jgi:hypothetical protein
MLGQQCSHYPSERRCRHAPVIPANNWDLGYWGGPEPSIKALLGAAANDIDSVSVHFYPMGPTYGESDESLLARP